RMGIVQGLMTVLRPMPHPIKAGEFGKVSPLRRSGIGGRANFAWFQLLHLRGWRGKGIDPPLRQTIKSHLAYVNLTDAFFKTNVLSISGQSGLMPNCSASGRPLANWGTNSSSESPGTDIELKVRGFTPADLFCMAASPLTDRNEPPRESPPQFGCARDLGPAYFCNLDIAHRDRTAWLGMQDSNSETASQIIPLKGRTDLRESS